MLDKDLGLYYYVSRWYDPSLGRFIQADTLVPDPANPMYYDRYAYVMNNPIGRNDPTGHDCEGPQCPLPVSTPLPEVQSTPSPEQNELNINPSTTPTISLQPEMTLIGVPDPDGMRIIEPPTAIGIHFGGALKVGFIGEVGPVAQVDIIRHLETNEIGVFITKGDEVTTGLPSGVEVSGFFGITYYYGASRLSSIEGSSDYLGFSGTLDSIIIDPGISFSEGRAMRSDDRSLPFIDPISREPVISRQVDIAIGGDAISNFVDFGLFGGTTYSQRIYRFTDIPIINWFYNMLGGE